jgi:hypothetical protein
MDVKTKDERLKIKEKVDLAKLFIEIFPRN